MIKQDMSQMLRIFRIDENLLGRKVLALKNKLSLVDCKEEVCFNVEISPDSLSQEEQTKLMWLLSETYEPSKTVEHTSFFSSIDESCETVVEVGPRLAYSTAWSSNCVSMCRACGIENVSRIERSRRYKLTFDGPFTQEQVEHFTSLVHDRMTECVYSAPLASFDSGAAPEPVFTIPLLEKGAVALEDINQSGGLGFDEQDLQYYAALFRDVLQRDPTNVELFDLAQSNSEHSRHWFFSGRMVLDGQEQRETLFQLVKSTLTAGSNSVIAFHDNSSVNCSVSVFMHTSY